MAITPSLMNASMAPSIIGSTAPTIQVADLPKTLLYPSDIELSINAYENLLQTAKAYRNQLANLSQSANAFGAALEACSRTKGVDGAAEGLINVAGLQYLVANHQSVLSDTIYRSFEIPLRENLENFVLTTEQRREEYKNELQSKMKLLAKREREHLALAHKKQRSLNKFREALADLTSLADGIEKLKSDYFYNALDYHCETWSRVSLRSNIVCKAELSLYSGIAQKAEHLEWSLVGTPDPWNQDARIGDEIFQIVPPQEILARPQSPSHEDVAGLFQSLLSTVNSQDSPGPPRRQHNQLDTKKSNHISAVSFFSIPSRNGHSMLKPKLDALQDQEHEGMTPTTHTIKQETPRDSPYQDAEEEESETVTTVKNTVSPFIRARRPTITSICTVVTPSRPSSKRSNAQPCQSPMRDRHNSIKQIFTPPSKSARSDSEEPNRRSGLATTSAAAEMDSPESDDAQKHSEFCNIKVEPED